MNEWRYPGAKWWKFDFHTHTPASTDFKEKYDQQGRALKPEGWIRNFMEKKIDCVAITDHNSGEWIDELKETLSKIQSDNPDWYHPLYLFPGVEISANGNVHVLAIFDREKSGNDIVKLIGAVDYKGSIGDSDAVTKKSLTEVVDIIVDHDGIAIPAHVDRRKGLFEELKGTNLKQVISNEYIFAMELCDREYKKPQVYIEEKLNWTEVRGSDLHDFKNERFGRFTWVKMDEPSIEGLKLALIDGTASTDRNMNHNPNQHTEYFIEELTVSNAKYLGRPELFNFKFSPFMNTIIGGRGSGKSTMLEFIRLILKRNNKIPDSLISDLNKYFNIGEDNLLLENSKLSIVIRKGDVCYRLNWSAQADDDSLEEESNGEWVPLEGDIRSLFPVQIYSQKHIFELAKNPRHLLEIIDQNEDVKFREISEKQQELIHDIKNINLRLNSLEDKVSQSSRLKGELTDVKHQIRQIEQSGHKDVLQSYRKRKQQLTAFGVIETNWTEMADQISDLLHEIDPVNFNEQLFEENEDILSSLKQANNKWKDIKKKLEELTSASILILEDWKKEKSNCEWMSDIQSDIARYQQLREQFEDKNIDPETYPLILQKQENINHQLKQTENDLSQINKLKEEKYRCELEYKNRRAELSGNREAFLNKILTDNQSVSIHVKIFGEDWVEIEKDLRKLLQCGERFDNDINELKIIHSKTNPYEVADAIKEHINDIISKKKSARDQRFFVHLNALPHESLVDFSLWFPKDDLEIKIGKQQSIKQGSPGQQTAALLAFILSYGSEPLLLDQPEDDLDNELIYSLVVKQLRENKHRRQMIIVTHNANIVVNGDAELVIPLIAKNGQTKINQLASIQNAGIRKNICDVLEGGLQAFQQRYKRIHLRGEDNV